MRPRVSVSEQFYRLITGRDTHIGDRAAHGVQCEFRDRVQAGRDDLERGQDRLW